MTTQTVQRRGTRRNRTRGQQQQNVPNTVTNRGRVVPIEFRMDGSKLPELPGHMTTDLKSEVNLLLDTAKAVSDDSPAAAVGIAAILASYQHPFRTYALSEMLEHLQGAQWSPQLQALATSAVRQETRVYQEYTEEGKPYNVEGLLKLQLREQEYRLVGYFMGNTRSIRDVGNTSASIASELRSTTDSEKSQAIARVIAATGYRFTRPTAGVLSGRNTWEELKMAAPIIAAFWEIKGVVEALELVSTSTP